MRACVLVRARMRAHHSTRALDSRPRAPMHHGVHVTVWSGSGVIGAPAGIISEGPRWHHVHHAHLLRGQRVGHVGRDAVVGVHSVLSHAKGRSDGPTQITPVALVAVFLVVGVLA